MSLSSSSARPRLTLSLGLTLLRLWSSLLLTLVLGARLQLRLQRGARTLLLLESALRGLALGVRGGLGLGRGRGWMKGWRWRRGAMGSVFRGLVLGAEGRPEVGTGVLAGLHPWFGVLGWLGQGWGGKV